MNTSQRKFLQNSTIAAALVLAAFPLVGSAQERHREESMRAQAPHVQTPHMVDRAVETHPGPHGYQRITRPSQVQARPKTFDPAVYRHNYRADRGFKIGPYRAPKGHDDWKYRRWHSGEILPPIFWGSDYLISDFWLFDLDIPPVGYEWVRYGNDALLVNTTTGEVVQEVYDSFL